MELVSVAGIAIAGCQPRASMPEPQQCSPGVPSNAQHPIASRTSLLTGDYKLIQVHTQPAPGTISSGRLRLEPLDSAARAGAVGGAVRDLVGWLELEDDESKRRAAFASSTRSPPGAALRGHHLILGNPGELNGYVEHLTITAVAPEGFWGWWKAQTGVEVTTGREGRILPDPAGYFCALRVPS